MFDSCFLKTVLENGFENTKNTLLVFFENYSSFEFSAFCVLYILQNKKTT